MVLVPHQLEDASSFLRSPAARHQRRIGVFSKGRNGHTQILQQVLKGRNDSDRLLSRPVAISVCSQGFGNIAVRGERNIEFRNRQTIPVGPEVLRPALFLVDGLTIRIHLVGHSIVKSDFCNHGC